MLGITLTLLSQLLFSDHTCTHRAQNLTVVDLSSASFDKHIFLYFIYLSPLVHIVHITFWHFQCMDVSAVPFLFICCKVFCVLGLLLMT